MSNNHDLLVIECVRSFRQMGFRVETEVPLPDGKGALDLLVSKGYVSMGFEVKSSPKSLSSGKVAKQFDNYRAHFGNLDLGLISPGADSNPRVQVVDGYTGSLQNYLQNF